MQNIADLRGWSRLIALQIEYSLIERTAERELIPMARELGLDVIPWSPLASGVLSGKYSEADLKHDGDLSSAAGTRKNVAAANGALSKRTCNSEHGEAGSYGMGKRPSQVAIAWTPLNPSVTTPILGARTVAQLVKNLGALELDLDVLHREELALASAIDLGFPHEFLARPMTRGVMFGNSKTAARE